MPLSAKLVGNIYYNVTLGRCRDALLRLGMCLPAPWLHPTGREHGLCGGPNRPDPVLSVCLSEDRLPHPAPKTDERRPGCSAGWGSGDPRSQEGVSEAWGGEACGPAVLAQWSPARRPLCSGRRGLLKGGDAWAQVCREPHPDPVRLVADNKVDGAQTRVRPWAAGWVLRPKHC